MKGRGHGRRRIGEISGEGQEERKGRVSKRQGRWQGKDRWGSGETVREMQIRNREGKRDSRKRTGQRQERWDWERSATCAE